MIARLARKGKLFLRCDGNMHEKAERVRTAGKWAAAASTAVLKSCAVCAALLVPRPEDGGAI